MEHCPIMLTHEFSERYVSFLTNLDSMVLLDALYINDSGGFRLLEYLVDELLLHEVDFYLLADARCRGKFDKCENVSYMNASLWGRFKFYQVKGGNFSSVLCFGNIPAPVKMEVPVYTYFHNINLLTLNGLPSIWTTASGWMKRQVYRYYKKNTDYWLVQTSNTREELLKHLGEKEKRVRLMPFYNIPERLNRMAQAKHGDDYVYVANYTGSKQHETLLEAWIILHEKGIDKTLHLTVPETATAFLKMVKEAQQRKVKVLNHGFVPFCDVMELYAQSKAIIYPSLNESLGLGLVEAITAGCDVIGADLPYTYSVCKPSLVFDVNSAESIAEAVMVYEVGKAEKSELKIHNMIDEMIDMLSRV